MLSGTQTVPIKAQNLSNALLSVKVCNEAVSYIEVGQTQVSGDSSLGTTTNANPCQDYLKPFKSTSYKRSHSLSAGGIRGQLFYDTASPAVSPLRHYETYCPCGLQQYLSLG